MSIHIYPSQKQIKGNFNGGEIMENKPIQMSHDHTKLQPYSNIFYWAHAWAEVTSTIGLHPHQAFEIVSFVLTGTVEHYDTKNKTWLPLQAGDVQIIRAGNGISHAEKMLEGTHMFQIWLIRISICRCFNLQLITTINRVSFQLLRSREKQLKC
jgi:redox-sensitive bicupin YhaK (pirin superfamily)